MLWLIQTVSYNKKNPKKMETESQFQDMLELNS